MLSSSRLADGRFNVFGLLYLPGAVGEEGIGRRRGDLDLNLNNVVVVDVVEESGNV